MKRVNGYLVCKCSVVTTRLKDMGVDDSEFVDTIIRLDQIDSAYDARNADDEVVGCTISVNGLSFTVNISFEEVSKALLNNFSL